MALTLQSIKTEGEAIMKSMYPGAQESEFQVSYACDTLVSFCLNTPVDKWKRVLIAHSQSNGNNKTQEKFSAMYKGHLKDPQNKSLAERITENPKMLHFFSAIVVKLFDALTWENGKLPSPTDRARAAKLGQDIVKQYLTFKRTQTKFPKRWELRLALDKKYRQHFKYSIDENDLDALKEDLSCDEIMFERKRKLEDIPEETKFPKLEHDVHRMKEEYEKSKATTDELGKKYKAALKDKRSVKEKLEAKNGIEEVAQKMCSIENKPSTEMIKLLMQKLTTFCMVEFENKIENPYKLIIFDNLAQSSAVSFQPASPVGSETSSNAVNENLDVSNAQAVDEPFVDESDLNQRVPTKITENKELTPNDEQNDQGDSQQTEDDSLDEDLMALLEEKPHSEDASYRGVSNEDWVKLDEPSDKKAVEDPDEITDDFNEAFGDTPKNDSDIFQ